jgi:hypothetical protein
MIYVRMALALQGAFIGDPIFDVNDEAAARLGRLIHTSPERQEPINVTIRMDTAVSARISVGRTCEEQVNAGTRKLLQ